MFFSIFGKAIKRFENVTVVKRRVKKMGYRGFLLKNLAQLNGETVKNWVHCNSPPGTATNDIVTLHHIRKINSWRKRVVVLYWNTINSNVHLTQRHMFNKIQLLYAIPTCKV